MLGLDRTGHMSFLTGQDWTPKFAGQVLPDPTESGLIFLNSLPTKYRLSILINHNFGVKRYKQKRNLEETKLKKSLKKKVWIFFSIFKSIKSPTSGKENVQFQDSPDFKFAGLPDWT